MSCPPPLRGSPHTGTSAPQRAQTRPTILLDLDDTLVDTCRLFDEAIAQWVTLMNRAAVGDAESEKRLRIFDIAQAQKGYRRASRFPSSMMEVYRQLTKERGLPLNSRTVLRARRIGEAAYERAAPLLLDAAGVVPLLACRYRIVLYTQGEAPIQRRRAEESGLMAHVSHIVIVEQKDAETLAAVLRDLRLPAKGTIAIGDSLRLDIAPAVELGLRAIHVERRTSYAYHQVALDPSRYQTARDLYAVAGLLGLPTTMAPQIIAVASV